MITFAFIEDVWNLNKESEESKINNRTDPLCNLITGEDAIMTTYLNESKKNDELNIQCFDYENIEGFQGNNYSLLDNAFQFDDFYKINNMNETKKQKEQQYIQEESKKIFKDIVYSKINNTTAMQIPEETKNTDIQLLNSIDDKVLNSNVTIMNQNFNKSEIFDLILYIVSGVFIIFMLEQVFNLGLMMR